MMLALSHFSHVQLSVTPWTIARLAPLSMGFFRQEYWSGLLFPSPEIKYEVSEVSEIAQSCLTLIDPMDCSLPTRLLCSWDFPGKSTGSRTPQRPGQTFLH